MRHSHGLLVTSAVILCLATSAVADEFGQKGTSVHLGLTGVISKIQSGVLFVKMPVGLRPRTISPNKADRVGLHEAKVGEGLLLWVDEGNVLMDVHKIGQPFVEHRIVAGTLSYADPYWGEIKLSTPEGTERFEVDTLAGSKLSVFEEGAPVIVELDGDNVMIDIRRTH